MNAALPALAALSGTVLRLWRLDGEHWVLCAGDVPAPRGRVEATSRVLIPGTTNLFLEVAGDDHADIEAARRHLLLLAQQIVEAEHAAEALTAELATRYEEIDLLYTIGELLARAQPVGNIAPLILREVCAVVGARQAALRVYDDTRRVLRAVAMLGTDPDVVPADAPVDDPDVVIARAFKSGRVETGMQPAWVPGEVVAVPITYAVPGTVPRVIGTLALADRAGGGSFTRPEIRLISAIATQIGAALENSRLTELEREQQRLAHELRLAHDLQLRLMPTPAVLRGDADVSVRSEPAESVGGDFYTFARLGRGRVGIMLGDVASHGMSAALIAAEVLAAAGIHANTTTPPDETLTLLRDSLADELEKTEMYLTIFYGILDPTAGRLIYASAGHPHAFRVPRAGHAQRLEPTAPPLGLVEAGRFGRLMIPWNFGDDLLVLFTDGLIDQVDATGARFGEARLFASLEEARDGTPALITERVFRDVAAFGGTHIDDRTLLVLRM